MPAHTHTYSGGPVQGGNGTGNDWQWGTQNTSSAGGSQPHNNMPPFLVLAYIIKL